EATEKRQLDWASSIHAAEQEGKAEGRQEGEQVGLEKGKEEGKVEIATQMLSAHLPREQVCALTGLDTAKVAQLAEQLSQ
ncbi:MAG: transposase, partial [Bacteroidota bacterium]